MKKNIILHPFLLAVIPILALFEHNQDIASPYYLIYPLLISIVFTVIFFYLLSLVIKNKIKAGIITSILVVSFFLFDNFAQIFSIIETIVPADTFYYKHLALFVYLIIFIIILYLISRSKKSFYTINTLLNVFGIIVIVIQLFSISNYQLKSSTNEIYLTVEKNIPEINEVENINTSLPDIYYIILDGYGRQDVLQDLYNYDNSDFINYLTDKGFYVASKSSTNYNKTLLSIPSTLNMDYFYNIREKLGVYETDRKFFRTIIKENLVSNILEKNNYTFVTLPYTWFGNYKNLKSDIHLGGEHRQNSFNAILISKTPLYLLSAYWEMKTYQAKTLDIMERIPTIANLEETTFAYIHVMASHPPFLFDEDGPVSKKEINCLSGGDGNDYYETCPGVKKFRDDLTRQITYFNNRFKNIIDEILDKSDPEPIIIIQGDHGPGSSLHQGSLEQSDLKERMSILNAYYVPEEIKKELYPTISPVNSFRIILNNLFGYNFDILEDEHYFILDTGSDNRIDVTEKIKEINQ